MNVYPEVILFAVVLAINLFLLGVLLTGGLTLAFRFIENVSPRLRYAISLVVFLLAVLLPFAAALKTSPEQKATVNTTANLKQGGFEVEDFPAQNNALIRKDMDLGLTDTSKTSSADFLNEFISFATAPWVGGIFLGIWILGIGFLLFQEFVGIWRLKQARKLWKPAAESERQALLCPKDVTLYIDEHQSPGTIGLLRPVIVLPKHFPAGLSLDSKRFILRHEMAHAQWRDPLVSFLVRLIRAVFWISPALWLLERLINSEREAAADRAAIVVLSNESGFESVTLSYAETLLTVAKKFDSFGQQNGKSPVIGIGGGSDLETRIRRLLSSSRTTGLHIISAIFACALTLTTMAVIPLAAYSDKLVGLQKETARITIETEDHLAKENSSFAIKTDKQELISNNMNNKNLLPGEISATDKSRQFDRKLPKEIDYSQKPPNTEISQDAATTALIDKQQAARQLQESKAALTGEFSNSPARLPNLKGNFSRLNNLNRMKTGDTPAYKKDDGTTGYQARPINIPGEPAREDKGTVSLSKDFPSPASESRQ